MTIQDIAHSVGREQPFFTNFERAWPITVWIGLVMDEIYTEHQCNMHAELDRCQRDRENGGWVSGSAAPEDCDHENSPSPGPQSNIPEVLLALEAPMSAGDSSRSVVDSMFDDVDDEEKVSDDRKSLSPAPAFQAPGYRIGGRWA
ncbi:hypothetical protein HMN09_00661300 [Mycena chlorophos]|uniref:Uncharacterized protein n=1 Tax=Mycena chlorophos TaxID=658473 RepID=A0A8H6T0H7_MYCCL|nr:hypothetical protein HMN09_00661300 [Mycena chlorophos]